MLDLDALRQAVSHRVPAKRLAHTLCVEREADALAWRWNACREDARAAALLHDVTKGLSDEAQLKLCKEYDIVASQWEMGKLLHALTGAAVAEHEFSAPPAVVRAVRWHTTGRAGMSLLEKIIYLADYVDSTRRFHKVHVLRQLCYTNLEAALLMGFDLSIERQIATGRLICPATLEARNALLTNRGSPLRNA
ncbi:MAG: bis(5'-nucleosyl)-tetraphosphatase (symmetrical) YqeK [Oscillospiraceae bacterium]|nr:bis(5'-nucleosyl)-tetraphosphatase (symmetrical) YqeK [Oscillospiraceae bacterium]